MRATSILSEAWRNLATGTTRALLFALLLASLAGMLAAADSFTIMGLQAKAAQFRDSGAAIRTLVAEARIDPESCDALAQTTSISNAGALAASEPLTFSAMPGNSIPSFRVTPGLAKVLDVQTDENSGVWISDELAKTLQAAPGDVLPTVSGPLTIAGIFPWPDDGRDSRLGYAVLVPSRSQAAYDECWATIWPVSPASDDLLRSAATVDIASTTALNLSQVNKNHGPTLDGNAEYLARLTRGVPILGALAGLLLGYAATRSRRLEYAGALHAGARKPTILATALIETGVWTAAGAIIVATPLAVLAGQDATNLMPVFIISIKTLVIAVAGTLAGSAIGIAGIRERHLFRFFKDR